MELMLRCMMRVESETEQSRCAHEKCETRWRKNVKDFSSIISIENNLKWRCSIIFWHASGVNGWNDESVDLCQCTSRRKWKDFVSGFKKVTFIEMKGSIGRIWSGSIPLRNTAGKLCLQCSIGCVNRQLQEFKMVANLGCWSVFQNHAALAVEW